MRAWQPGDNGPADYALVRSPPTEMLQGRATLRGVFALGAGVDEILKQLQQNPEMLPRQRATVPAWKIPAWRGRCRSMRFIAY
ncbi:Glyoxylate/hydroxypyruvate reductase A [Pantoea agglomerans]|uniref:Glyoxylate/hydroxypyruvate reductase A n=1 Tax=Enterobacter agglomerans TaxID=549 RepID=A0A379AI60_ENTAG|nr:Glyoxylate/hydroxypyruvate reductase A [Pantoea agglomerans]